MRFTAGDRLELAGFRRTTATVVALFSLLVLVLSFVPGSGARLASGFQPEFAAMAPSTAACLLLLCVALVMPGRTRLAALCLVVAVVALTLPWSHSGGEVGLLDRVAVAAGGPESDLGRMSGATALGLLLVVVGLGWAGRSVPMVRTLTAVATVVVSGIALLGYLFGASDLYSLTGFATLSVPTAASLMALALAQLTLVTGGIVDVLLRGEDIGATLLRRLMPAVCLGLPTVSYAAVLVGQAGVWDESVTPVAIVMTWVVSVAGAVWLMGTRVSRVDRRRERAMAELALLNAELEDRAQARATTLSAEQRLSATMAERHRIAADLHDRVLQGLFVAGMQLHAAMEEGRAGTFDMGGLAEITDRIDRSVHDLRASVHSLHSKEGQTPTAALRDLERIRESARTTVPQVELTVSGPFEEVPAAEAAQLIAAAQEAVSNARRHANPTSIEIRVDVGPERLLLEVCDDGVGMPESIERRGGTASLCERAETFGGGCDWRQARPEDPRRPGTKLTWWVQVDRDEAAELQSLRQALAEPPDLELLDAASLCARVVAGAQPGGAVGAVLGAVMSAVSATAVVLTVPDPSQAAVLRVRAAIGFAGRSPVGTTIPRGDSLAGRVMQSRRGLTIARVKDLPLARREFGVIPDGPAVILPVHGPGKAQDSCAALLLCRGAGAAPFTGDEVARGLLLAVFVAAAL